MIDNRGTIATLTNNGTISGGNGAYGSRTGQRRRRVEHRDDHVAHEQRQISGGGGGFSGVSNALGATIKTLSNSGTISGGTAAAPAAQRRRRVATLGR